jgi:hypothetical protein
MNTIASRLLIGLAAIAAAQTVLADRLPIAPLEGSVESTADQVSLPVAEGGMVTARPCDECAARTFYLDKERELILNGHSVGLAEMTRALRSAGKVPVAVHYRVADSLVTRVVVMTK